MAARFTHVTFQVSSLERSIAFYRSVCGLEVVRDRRLEGGGTVWLGRPGVGGRDPSWVLVLAEGEVTDRLDHLGFQCASRAEVDAMAALGRSLGALVKGPLDAGGTIGYFALLADPDGHRVEFTHGQPLEGIA